MNWEVLVSRTLQVAICVEADNRNDAICAAMESSWDIPDKHWHEECDAYVIDAKD